MSATDSESSIDWLATDNEEDEDNELDVAARRPLVETLHPGRRADAVKRVWSAASDGGGDAARRPGQTTAGGEARIGRNPLKRPHGLVEGPPPQPLSIQEGREQVFTRKCMALQCYIHPLSSILNGLRSGRYREPSAPLQRQRDSRRTSPLPLCTGLSSFQESVAIDRIQRIMGVLQNPCMGEKYVNIILKMEDMLKSWFPNVQPQDQPPGAQTEHEAPPKKLKLSSPVSTDLTSAPSLASAGAPGVPAAHSPTALRVPDHRPPGAKSVGSRPTWLHASPICSPSAGQPPPPPPPPPPPQQAPPPRALDGPGPQPPAPRDQALTQDSAVSSSTDRYAKTDAAAPLKPPPLGKKINAPCLERLLKSTESIIGHKASGRVVGDS
ncbi:WAS/WASL-interacting protein family member 2 isoform X1 [Gadus chalcogrammus]|uniref:WAS/WASL-interacting protein family member 2 isoform X1 n=1 Tax=Gadus chalcogrammus TaxID=1042646 RepID=UPI0024C4B7F4|nr:WAS/WASL-interacting protein family member 2 isoform X1 [Gadus chalcogrammus]